MIIFLQRFSVLLIKKIFKYFVLLVEGCSDPDLPDNMWLKHFAHEALVGCKTGMQATWLLKCVRGTWEGQVGICSSGSASAPVQIPSKTKGVIIYDYKL